MNDDRMTATCVVIDLHELQSDASVEERLHEWLQRKERSMRNAGLYLPLREPPSV